ncbi:MAG: hypothetical protein ABGW81_02235 [Paracoccaceae bacterium]
MRNIVEMLHGTMPNYRHTIAGAILSVALAGCGWDSALQGYEMGPSEYAIARGMPTLQPVTRFRIADYTVPDPTDLSARFVILKRKLVALRGPVLTSTERARLEASIKRRIATQG